MSSRKVLIKSWWCTKFLAILWVDSRTSFGNFGEFGLVNNAILQYFASRNTVAFLNFAALPLTCTLTSPSDFIVWSSSSKMTGNSWKYVPRATHSAAASVPYKGRTGNTWNALSFPAATGKVFLVPEVIYSRLFAILFSDFWLPDFLIFLFLISYYSDFPIFRFLMHLIFQFSGFWFQKSESNQKWIAFNSSFMIPEIQTSCIVLGPALRWLYIVLDTWRSVFLISPIK